MSNVNAQIDGYVESLPPLSRKVYLKKCSLARDLKAFIHDKYGLIDDLLSISEDTALHDLKVWMTKKGLPLYSQAKHGDDGDVTLQAPLLSFYQSVVFYLITTADIPETEKDIWVVQRLPFCVRQNPSSVLSSIDFRRIKQEELREETKAACHLLLRREAISTVVHRIYAMNFFSQYLRSASPETDSATMLTRDVIESYLIYLRTQCTRRSSYAPEVALLKGLLLEIGRLKNAPEIEHLFLLSDRMRTPIPLYRTYSSSELDRLHACIKQLPEQMARVLLIHELLGTRISDTLAIKQDALQKIGGQWVLRIDQPKTQHSYQKNINETLAQLIQASIRHSNALHKESPYVFASEKDPSIPIQYAHLRSKLLSVYRANNLFDDAGRPMSTGTHLFRHTYGQRLTELNIDDATIAKLLGHRSTASVKHYRKIRNETLETETRAMRKNMDAMIRQVISDWN